MAHMKKHQKILDEMLKTFCQKHAPCEYKSNRFDCVVSRISHTKGHQNDRGKIFADGKYMSSFTYETYKDKWEKQLSDEISAASVHFQRARGLAQGKALTTNASMGADSSDSLSQTEQAAIMKNHCSTLTAFYNDTDQLESFRSHTACVCCFVHVPQHVLTCGHALCSKCITAWAHEIRDCSVVIQTCPLHPDQPMPGGHFTIGIKPKLAGVRVLTLDGYVGLSMISPACAWSC